MNLLLLSLDTTRADHLGCYGYSRNTSPHLDALAGEGTLFEHCYAPHIPTHPSHTTMFTGRDIFGHGIVAQGAPTELSAAVPTLAELLSGAGWFTAAADNLGRWFPRGFQRYERYAFRREEDGSWRKGETVAATAIRLLEEAAAQDRPFFLFAHFWDPHTPYLPPPPFSRMFYGGNERDPAHNSLAPALAFPPFADYFRQWLEGVTDIRFPIAQYDACIAYMDLCVARLLHRLEELGLAEETAVVITADHGEELDEHAMWFDHHGLYDTNLHIPLLVRLPREAGNRRRVRNVVSQLDVTPSLLDLAGLADHPATAAMQGRSWLPLLRGDQAASDGEPLFLTECTWMRKRGVRTTQWKLIVARDHPDLHGRPPVELYDLQRDPREQVNLAEERPEVVALLREQLEAWRARRTAEAGRPDPIELQEITLRRVGPPRPPA
jgi:arylsulfatase A-like enzyme